MNASGSLVDQRTVRFGSGAAPKFSSVCRYLNDDFETIKSKGRKRWNDILGRIEVDDTDIDYCKSNIEYRYSLYSDTDRVVPFNILEDFVKEIKSVPQFIPGAGHMGNKENTTRLPKIIDILNELELN